MCGGNDIMELDAFHPRVLRAAGALPGDDCPLSHCPPLPGDTVDPLCVTGELWLLLQGSLHCVLNVESLRGAGPRPQRGVLQTSSSRADAQMPRVFLLPFTTERHLPGSPWDRRSSGT